MEQPLITLLCCDYHVLTAWFFFGQTHESVSENFTFHPGTEYIAPRHAENFESIQYIAAFFQTWFASCSLFELKHWRKIGPFLSRFSRCRLAVGLREPGSMNVRSRKLRMFVCAALAAAATTFGTGAQAVFHSLPFDPFTFAGVINVDIPSSCLVPSDDTHLCTIDFLSVDFTDTFGNHWVTGTPFTETDLINVDDDGAFFALQATLGSPFLALTGDSNGCDGTQQLIFELPGEGNDGQRRISFSCVGEVGDNVGRYSVERVPEPAPLALFGLALAGLALSRRRALR